MSDKITIQQFRKLNKKRKYHNNPKVYNGRTYHSTLEADYAAQLDIKKRIGMIKSYTPQYPIKLHVKGELVCTYRIDFKVDYPDGRIELVECKGYETPAWKLKFKLTKILIGDILPGAELVLIKEV